MNYSTSLATRIYLANPNLTEGQVIEMALDFATVEIGKASAVTAMFYDEDFASDVVSTYNAIVRGELVWSNEELA
jgi:hypothetical protein